MKTEHRGILAVALSALFFLLWFTVIHPSSKEGSQPERSAAPASSGSVPVAAEAQPLPAPRPASPPATLAADPQGHLPVKTWSISNGVIDAEFTNDGGVPLSWRVVGYHRDASPTSAPIDLVSTSNAVPPPLALVFPGAGFAFPERPRYEIAAADKGRIVFRWRSKEVEVIKTITFREASYLVDVAVEAKSLGGAALSVRPALLWSGLTPSPVSGGWLSFLKQPSVEIKAPVFYLDGKVKRETNLGKMPPRTEAEGQVLWAGIESRYFLGAVIPRVQGQGLAIEYGKGGEDGQLAEGQGLWAGAILPAVSAPAGESARALFSVYAGPKEIELLKQAGVRLEEAIDYGWFTIVAIPILYLLRFFHGAIHNWGIAIILLTIFVKLLLHPINVRSLKSMKAMQQLQPRLKELQKKFQDDRQRLNQETMQLFRAHKANPMGGCLPMLLQFPIYIALYKVLWNSIELYHAPFFWFYRDLSAPDPYFITPILLGIFMVAQQRLMPSTSADPAQQKMMMLMPVMFSAFMLFLPVGLVVYILVNTAMSVTQQHLYNHGIRMRDLLRGRWRPARA